MKQRSAIVLVLVAGALVVGAYFALRGGAGGGASGDTSGDASGDAFIGGLPARAESIGAVEVLRGNATVRLDRQSDGTWRLTSNDGYPARTELVRGLVVSLGALTLDERMTAKPQNHGELGLAWPDSAGRSRRVRLLPIDPGASAVCDVMIGDERAQPDAVFVRTFDEPQTWRARGRVQLPGDALGWVNRSLMALPDDEVTSATIRGLTLTRPNMPQDAAAAANGTASASQGGPPPRWMAAISPEESWAEAQLQMAQSGLAPFLGRLEFDGVRRARVPANAEPKYSPVFETRGATVAIEGRRETDGVWFRLRIAPRAGAATTPAPSTNGTEVPDYAELAELVKDWEYLMPEWKASSLDRLSAQSAPAAPPHEAPSTAPPRFEEPQK